MERQYVGIDLHRWSSTHLPDVGCSEMLGCVKIVSQPFETCPRHWVGRQKGDGCLRIARKRAVRGTLIGPVSTPEQKWHHGTNCHAPAR